MKRIFITLLVLLFAVTAKSQLFILPYFTGTSTYGTYAVTATIGGSATTGGGFGCFIPATDQWWIGSGSVPGSFTYTFSRPVFQVSIHLQGINGGPLGGGEYMSTFINGAPYPLTPANILSFTECSPSAGAGPCYLSGGFFYGPVGSTLDYNGGDFVIQVCTGISSFEVYTNAPTNGIDYFVYIDTVRPLSCSYAINNSPCVGDSLKLDMVGDSTGATYAWTGPGTFTSTLQNPYIYPSVFADSGWYHIIRHAGVVNDTDSTYVVIHPKAVLNITNNSPLCIALPGTLQLTVSPDSAGETFLWSGPAGFTSTLQNPTRAGFVAIDSGVYHIYATTRFGCKDTGQTLVRAIQQPPTPIVTDQNYCQHDPFVAYALSDTISGDTVLWYTTASGGTGSTTPISVPTNTPGFYRVWVSQKLGACESLRGTDSVKVTTTPLAPSVSGIFQYCQFIGPVDSLIASHTPTGTLRWYNVATGGGFTSIQPEPDINTAGTYDYWVSQIDSTCESPRTPVVITVQPKPDTPHITLTPVCQYKSAGPLVATPSGTGDFLLWYGPGLTVGSTVAPVPGTTIAPDTVLYYVTETSIYGCVSDSALDPQVTKAKPPLPVTGNTKYCQDAFALPLNRLVDSAANSHLNWYYNATLLNPTPVPFTDTAAGTYTWYASQTINGCEGDSSAVNVTIIYKPVFGITSTSPSVCQYDTLTLSYYGPQLPPAPAYLWTLPAGAIVVNGTSVHDSVIRVQFDTANQNNYVTLHASDDSGFCATDSTIRIKVIALPFIGTTTKPNVCLGDTVLLGLSYINNNAHNFTWYIDKTLMASSPAINLVTGNSNSWGPFKISWIDSGQHTITVTSVTEEGCKSNSAYDSVYVRPIPDATFRVIDTAACINDSAIFVANTNNYNYSYEWAPVHSFNNINSATIYGRMELPQTIVTLTVTDPYGCMATASTQVEAHTCCAIAFPNAFAPNSGSNRVFRPIPGSGYHNYHQFVIVNRWGQTVFNGGNTNVSWDGNYNDVPQDMGVYYYYLKYDCGGATLEQKGDVTLIR